MNLRRDEKKPPMSDPGEGTQVNPHPVSEHRTPREIALDEAGPIGQADRDLGGKESPSKKSPRAPGARRTTDVGSASKRRKNR